MQSTTLLSTVLGFFILFTSSTTVHANVSAGENGMTKRESESPTENIRCTFRTRQYLPGQVWHANTSSPHCVVCTCTKTGKLNCTNLDCCAVNGSTSTSKRRIGDEDDGGGGGGGGGDRNISISLDTERNKKSVTTMEKAMAGLTKAESEGINACCEEACGRRTSATIQTISQDEKDSSSHYDDEETDDDPLVNANLEHVSCLHQGKIYRDKDSFASDLTGLPISSRHWDHCMHCSCQAGMVLCTLKSCSDFDCGKITSSSTVKEACCAKCSADWKSVNKKTGGGGGVTGSESGQKPKSAERSGDMNDIADAQYQYLYTSITTTNNEQDGVNVPSPQISSSSSASTTTSQEASKHFIINHRLLATASKRAGCVSAGKFYFHGQTWHPIIGPFGSMECVLCKCLHSRIECSRLPCPSVTELQCPNLVKLEGHCCPTCVSPTALDDGPKQLCVPIYQDVTVYKSTEYFTGNETEVTRLSFVRVKGNWNPKFQVEVHEWAMAEGKVLRFYTTYYTLNDFLNLQNKKPSIILGATTTRNLEKFTKREKKLHFRCKAHCTVRIQSLQLTLRLHELITKPKCSPTERSVQNSV